MHKLGSWLSCGNWTIVDEYDEKCRLCNPFKLTKGFAEQIKYCNSCLEEFYDSDTRGNLCSICHYDRIDKWEYTYPGMNGKYDELVFSLFLEKRYRRGFNCFWRKN